MESGADVSDYRVDFSETRRSPDGAHTALLLYAGEIRFGPTVYKVELDGRLLRRHILWSRNFGEACLWSPDSRYVALSEWRHLSETLGPDTELIVIDVAARRECAPDRAHGGFAQPVRFCGSRLSYTKTFYKADGKTQVEHNEIDLSTFAHWHRLWLW